MQTLGIFLILGYYLAMQVFLGTYVVKALQWMKIKPANAAAYDKITPKTFILAALDIIFSRRLLIVNEVLWIGEWVFHVSFALVMLRHLRYFLDPVPEWVWFVQPLGIIAGYVLPAALGYIAVMKLCIEKKQYVSSYNFFLLALIFVMSVTGLLMKNVYHPDIIAIKEFIIGAVTFRFLSAPESPLFIFHFIMVLILVVKLPTHVFTAPLTIMEARQRNETVKELVHGK